MLLQPNPPWHHTILNQQLIDRLLDAIPRVVVDRQVALYCGINPSRLYDWIRFGQRDMDAGINNSIYADFFQQYFEKKSQVLEAKLNKLSTCPKNYGAITYILDRCFKDDFEVMSEDHKKLLDYVENIIKPLLSKGALLDGKETQERREETEEEIL